jgi:hypothetical protein
MTVVVGTGAEIEDETFDAVVGAVGDHDQGLDDFIVRYCTGAYSLLEGFSSGQYFIRVYRDYGEYEGDGFTRYCYLPFFWNPEYIRKLLDEHGWPLNGSQCTHSYSPCGNVYCGRVVLSMTDKGPKAEQHMWRNV